MRIKFIPIILIAGLLTGFLSACGKEEIPDDTLAQSIHTTEIETDATELSTTEPVTEVSTVQATTVAAPTEKATTKPAPTDAPQVSAKQKREQEARAAAKKIAGEIISDGMTEEEKAFAIASYMWNNVEKQMDQSNDAYKKNFGNEAYAALVLHKAACSGVCKGVKMLCEEVGLECQHINAHQWTHQWNLVKVNGEWVVLDGQLPPEIGFGLPEDEYKAMIGLS